MTAKEQIVAIHQTPATKHLQRQVDELNVKVKCLNLAFEAAADKVLKLEHELEQHRHLHRTT